MMTSIFNWTIKENGTETMAPSRSNATTMPDDDDDFGIALIRNISNYTRQNNPRPEPSFYDPRQNQSSVGVLVLAILLVVLTILLTVLVMHILRYRLMRRLVALGRQQSTHPQVSPEQKDDRYSIIEDWLISKRVLKHDDACQRILEAGQTPTTDSESCQQQQSTTSISRAASEDSLSYSDCQSRSADTSRDPTASEENACPICMSPFLNGEIVSCSADEQCKHICKCIDLRLLFLLLVTLLAN